VGPSYRPRPEQPDELICYKRAAEARRLAKAALDPAQKADLFDVERGWLSLARAEEEKRAARPDFVLGSIQNPASLRRAAPAAYAFVPGNSAVVDFR
jgi:hypothetical protein